MEAVGKQTYKLRMPSKWRIHLMFHIPFLKRDVTRKKVVDQKIADQIEFEKRKQPEQKVDLIMHSIVFAKEAIDDRLPWLYYVIH